MKRASQKGYTILEVMIVITVSAAMFVAAVVSFSGRNQQVQFSQSVRDLESKLNDIVNDVAVGFFDNPSDLVCRVSGPAPGQVDLSIDNSNPASLGECIFLGKVLQFAPNNTGGIKAGIINVYSVLGRRISASGAASLSLSDAEPILIGNTADPVDPLKDFGKYVQRYQLQWGLTITGVVYDGSPVEDYGGVGFFSSFAKTFKRVDVSNNQAVKYSFIPASSLATTEASFVNNANGKIKSSLDLAGKKAVTVCVKSPEGKIAAIVLGGDNSTSTEIQFDNYNPDVCK